MEKNNMSKKLSVRPRRLRASEAMRRLVRETHLNTDALIMPYFVTEGEGVREPIESMPGQFRFSVDTLIRELKETSELGVRAILIFGVPGEKDTKATSAFSRGGITQRAVSAVKENFPDLLVITDVCLCAFMSHGHCGVINEKGEIDNDASLEILAEVALSHARAGADMVAPSDMMDGRIHAIRAALDAQGFENTSIMSYAAKYASAFYGPFRDAAHSAPASEGKIPSDRKTYQMDPANRLEALREMELDLSEGADILMVKPALAYLDIIRDAREAFRVPLAAYAVSGEYSMIKAAAERGMLDEKSAVLEAMISLKRAGADILITYHAKDIARWIRSSSREAAAFGTF